MKLGTTRPIEMDAHAQAYIKRPELICAFKYHIGLRNLRIGKKTILLSSVSQKIGL